MENLTIGAHGTEQDGPCKNEDGKLLLCEPCTALDEDLFEKMREDQPEPASGVNLTCFSCGMPISVYAVDPKDWSPPKGNEDLGPAIDASER